MTAQRPRFLDTPTGALEWVEVGRGEPVTVFAHGLGNSIESTRPFASGVPGRRVFFHFRGHGASAAPPGEWTYDDLAAELGAVADHVGATRALGVSMGAGALCALLTRRPERFDRVVLALPAALDRPRAADLVSRSAVLADLLEGGGDPAEVARALAAEQVAGAESADAVAHWAAEHARWLLGSSVAQAYRQIPRHAPVSDAAQLAPVSAPMLVIAQEDDPLHPTSVARAIAAVVPGARLEIMPPGGLLWGHRATLRRLVTDFLAGAPGPATRGEST